MELFVMDENFMSLYNLDVFESLIWTERYNGCGNFEFYTPVSPSILNIVDIIQKRMNSGLDTYVYLKESKGVMIIEDLEITTDAESGNHLIVSGRGLESILERRIIWEQTTINGSFQNGVRKLINDALISPKLESRKIPNFVFKDSASELIKGLRLRAQYTGDNLYDTILTLCNSVQLGFDITLSDQNKFEFILVAGEDRSYDQLKNPYVIFSTNYENLVNSDYLESNKTLKNVALVAGEDQGTLRRTRIVGASSGLSRRELYVDARDIQSDTDSGTISDEDYDALLDQRGIEKLDEKPYTKAFTGEVEALKTFVYGEDFYKGDIVQIVNEYGIQSKVRVSEVVRVQDTNGYKMYPTFQVVE